MYWVAIPVQASHIPLICEQWGDLFGLAHYLEDSYICMMVAIVVHVWTQEGNMGLVEMAFAKRAYFGPISTRSGSPIAKARATKKKLCNSWASLVFANIFGPREGSHLWYARERQTGNLKIILHHKHEF